MEEQGIVVSVTQGHARVRLTPTEACGGCSQKSACHPGDADERLLDAVDPLGVKPGQVVTVQVPGRGVWMALGLAYGFPLLLLFVGAYLGFRLAGPDTDRELASALSALAGLASGFLLLRRYRHHYEGRVAFRAVVVGLGK